MLAFVAVLYLNVDMSDSTFHSNAAWLPAFAPVGPTFTIQSFFSVALPLYLVKMAGQNIPGFAVLELNGYPVERQPMIRKTGLVSLLIAPFGSIPVNMSAITAALMATRTWAATRQRATGPPSHRASPM